MPLDTIYLTRHGHRLSYTVDLQTGIYRSTFPTPTGNPADPCLTSHGVRQSHELAAHIAGASFHPKPFVIYSSPFYRCLQTIEPSVQALRALRMNENGGGKVNVRVENGIGEWFGQAVHFTHPPPCSLPDLHAHFPALVSDPASEGSTQYSPCLFPSPSGESIEQLHDRVATTLQCIISDLDAEIAAFEARQSPEERRTSKAVLIVSHAAPLIAMGRVLTGNMPLDSGVKDFHVFTAGLSTFTRRSLASDDDDLARGSPVDKLLAPGTRALRPAMKMPDWRNGRGVGGGWDCVSNGDCHFLSDGAERGWSFSGEESFDQQSLSQSELQSPRLISIATKL